MDNMTIIAVVSIVTAGLTIALGSIDGTEFTGAAAGCGSDDHADAVCGPGDDRVHCHLLFCRFDDSDFCESVLESCDFGGDAGGGEVTYVA